MSATSIQPDSLEEIVEFENPLNGEVYFISTTDITEFELMREQLRLQIIARYLSSPSHQERVQIYPEEWDTFAALIIGHAN